VVFANGTMFSVSGKYDSVNKHTQLISESMKLHILGCGKMPMKFITQLANNLKSNNNLLRISVMMNRCDYIFVTFDH